MTQLSLLDITQQKPPGKHPESSKIKEMIATSDGESGRPEIENISNEDKYIIDSNGRKSLNYLYRVPSFVREDPENYLRSLEYQYEDEHLSYLIKRFRNGSKRRIKGQWKETVPPWDPYTLYQIFTYAESRKDSGKHFERDER